MRGEARSPWHSACSPRFSVIGARCDAVAIRSELGMCVVSARCFHGMAWAHMWRGKGDQVQVYTCCVCEGVPLNLRNSAAPLALSSVTRRCSAPLAVVTPSGRPPRTSAQLEAIRAGWAATESHRTRLPWPAWAPTAVVTGSSAARVYVLRTWITHKSQHTRGGPMASVL